MVGGQGEGIGCGVKMGWGEGAIEPCGFDSDFNQSSDDKDRLRAFGMKLVHNVLQPPDAFINSFGHDSTGSGTFRGCKGK